MTDFDLYYMLSCIFGGGLALILVSLLAAPPPEFIRAERIGMGIMGGATVMLLPRLYTQAPTPFDGWSTTLLWSGCFVFFSARAYRALRHWWANRAQTRMWHGGR